MTVLLQIFSWFWQWNKFEYWSIYFTKLWRKNGAILGPPCTALFYLQWPVTKLQPPNRINFLASKCSTWFRVLYPLTVWLAAYLTGWDVYRTYPAWLAPDLWLTIW